MIDVNVVGVLQFDQFANFHSSSFLFSLISLSLSLFLWESNVSIPPFQNDIERSYFIYINIEQYCGTDNDNGNITRVILNGSYSYLC